MQKERRRFVRLSMLTDVAYAKRGPQVQNKTDEPVFIERRGDEEEDTLSLAKNISAGGICLIAFEQMSAGDLLDLKICLPAESEIINAVGKVAWVKEFMADWEPKVKRCEVGVEFVEIKESDMERINQFVFKHTQ